MSRYQWTAAKDKLPQQHAYVNIVIEYHHGGISDFPIGGFLSDGNIWFAINDFGWETPLPLDEGDKVFWVGIPAWDDIGLCNKAYADNACTMLCKLPSEHDGRCGSTMEQARKDYMEAKGKGLVP